MQCVNIYFPGWYIISLLTGYSKITTFWKILVVRFSKLKYIILVNNFFIFYFNKIISKYVKIVKKSVLFFQIQCKII